MVRESSADILNISIAPAQLRIYFSSMSEQPDLSEKPKSTLPFGDAWFLAMIAVEAIVGIFCYRSIYGG